MAVLIRPKRWGMRKPALGASVDWSHPLSDGLITAILFNEGGGQTGYDLARGFSYALQGNLYGTQGVGPLGDYLGSTVQITRGAIVNGGGSNTGISCGLPNEILNATDVLTVMAGCVMSTTDANGLGSNNPIIVAWSSSNGSGGAWQLDVNTNNLRFVVGGAVCSASGVYPGGLPTIVAGTYNSSSKAAAVYLNGVQKATASGTGSILANTSANLTIGYRVYPGSGGFPGAWTGQVGFVYIWRRILTPGDIQRMNADPYGIILPPSHQRFWQFPLSQPDTGSADLELAAAATVAGLPSLSGAVLLSASATPAAEPSASASIAAVASATEAARPSAAGDLELAGAGTPAAEPSGSADLELAGAATPSAPSSGSGSLSLVAAASASGGSSASGDVELAAAGVPSGSSSATAAIGLVAQGSPAGGPGLAGTISLTGSATAGLPIGATASLSFVGVAEPLLTGHFVAWTFGEAEQRQWRFGSAQTVWLFGTAVPRSSLPAETQAALLVP